MEDKKLDAMAAGEWLPTSDTLAQYILSGRVQHLPKRKANEVRIFISSTFTDMHAERNALFKTVYPKLQSYCRTRWDLDFQAVDMRWGIQGDATNDHSAARLCMAELRNCQEQSLGPNFVLLLGQRYGSRQLPSRIPESEFSLLVTELEFVNTPVVEMDLLQKWFLCDANSHPPQRRLQPINVMGTETNEFSKSIEPQLLRLLRAGADGCWRKGLISQDDHHRYFWSVTDEEVYNGILTAKDPNSHCLYFSRKLTNLDLKHKKAWRFIDMDATGCIDTQAQELLESMHKSVLNVIEERNIVEYTIPWCADGGVNETAHATYLAEFCNDFYEKVVDLVDKAAAKHEPADIVTRSTLLLEIVEHDHQALAKLRTFQGRDDILDAIKAYLEDDSMTPFIVQGESGFGKTSIMAVASVKVFQWLSDTNRLIVVRRFLGTTPESTNFESLVRGIVDQVTTCCGIRLESLYAGDPMELLHKLFTQLLPPSVKLVLFLDSLDQLSHVGDAYSLKWIPFDLPHNVKLVLSTLPKEHGLLERLQQRGYPETAFVKVDLLDANTSVELLLRWLVAQHRSLTDNQIEKLRGRFATAGQTSPLYAKLMFDIVRETPSYLSTEDFEKHLEPLKTPYKCIEHIFEDLRRKHGKMLVNRAIEFLGFSKQGLTENELVDILSLDDEVLNTVFQFHVPPMRRLPAVLWKRIRNDISEYIVEREAGGAKVLWWYHRQFIEGSNASIISKLNAIEREQVTVPMADYFIGTWANGRPKPFTYSDQLVQKLQLSTNQAEADRFVPAQPNVLSNGKPNARKIANLPAILKQMTTRSGLEPFLAEVVGKIQVMVGLFTLFSTSEAFDNLSFEGSSYNLGQHLAQKMADFKLIKKVLLLCCVTGSIHPVSLGPLLAGHLLPFYGASPVSDCLLEDIFSTGLECNAFVVRHRQLEGLEGRLIFDTANEHTGRIHRLLEVNFSDIISVSTKVVITDVGKIEVVLRYPVTLLEGDHFNLLAAANVDDTNLVAASLELLPLVYIFSVKKRDYLGKLDCRSIQGFGDFVITGMQAFRAHQVDCVAVWGNCHHGALIFSLQNCGSTFYRLTADRIFEVLPDKQDGSLIIIKPTEIIKLSVTWGEKDQLQVSTTTTSKGYLPPDITVTANLKSCTNSYNVCALASSDAKLYMWNTRGSDSWTKLVLDSPAHFVTAKEQVLAVCTQNFIYIVDLGMSKVPAVKCRIRRLSDRAVFLDGEKIIMSYRLGAASTLLLQTKNKSTKAVEINNFVCHAAPVTDCIHHDPMILTGAADGGMRVFAPLQKVDPNLDALRFDRMDVQIDAVRGKGEYAVTLSKRAKQASVWDLKTGKMLRRLLHETASELQEAAICSHTVVVADASGLISLWSLNESSEKPSAIIELGGFCGLRLGSDDDLYVLTPRSLKIISLPSGNVVKERQFLEDLQVLSHSWSPGGVALLVDPEEPSVELLTGDTYSRIGLSRMKGLPNGGQNVSDVSLVNDILILSLTWCVIFYQCIKNEILHSVTLRKAVILKSYSDIIGFRSSQKVHFFSVNKGVSQLGNIMLSGSKDTAVLSPDGCHCLVLTAPRVLKLFRIADLKEVGRYPFYCDVISIAFSEDSKHVLVGLADTRLLTFLVVDSKCTGHLDRLQSHLQEILQKPSTVEETEKRRAMLEAACGGLSSDSDDDEKYDVDAFDNINEVIIEPEETVGYITKCRGYAESIVCRLWRNTTFYPRQVSEPGGTIKPEPADMEMQAMRQLVSLTPDPVAISVS